MTAMVDDPILPPLRPDIEILPGPDASDGSPTYLLYDPLQATFEKADWIQGEILRLLSRPLRLSEVLQSLARTTPTKVTKEDVLSLVSDAVQKGLTRQTVVRPVEALEAEYAERRLRPLLWLFTHYLYFRLPLLHPDDFLAQILPWIRPLGSRVALLLYSMITLLGLVLTIQRLDLYLATFPYFFTWRGVVAYGIAIAFLKLIHEFSHAFTAKALGVRVPTMGLAFLFLWPVPFCDVTDAWRLPRRRDRLWISLAGIVAELIVGGLSLAGWVFAPPGVFRSIFFVLSSVTLASTFLVNLNPAMRFDGYYVLSDLLGIDNLQPRSFAALRWLYWKALFKADLAFPEKHLSRGPFLAMIVYALYAWIYRFFLYLGIAVFVYHAFTKVLGIFLFCLEVIYFLVRPVVVEIVGLYAMRSRLHLTLPGIGIFFLGCAGLTYLALPLPRRIAVPAITVPEKSQVVYVPRDGIATFLHNLSPGDQVKAGTLLVAVENPESATRLRTLRLEKEIQEEMLLQAMRDPQGRARLPELRTTLSRIEAEIAHLEGEEKMSQLQAELDGTILDWDRSIRSGTAVRRDQILGEIASEDRQIVLAYIEEADLPEFSVAKRVCFRPDHQPEKVWEGEVRAIAVARASELPYRGLASIAGGEIPVAPDRMGRLLLLESRYVAEILLDPPSPSGALDDLRLGQTGKVWTETSPRSLLLDLFHHILRILVRESAM